jgi:hypothetical protein
MLEPCQNSGSCTNNSSLLSGYQCTCTPDYTGTNCEVNIGPCKPNICLNYGESSFQTIQYRFSSVSGTCVRLNDTNFRCDCTRERIGTHCEILVHYCHNATCLNKGVCRPIPLGYKCECLSSDYQGRHCEHAPTGIVVRQYISKTFGYIAIIALVTVAGFVISMDLLKYVFGIDPIRRERDKIRRGRALLERRDRKNRKPQKTLGRQRLNKVSPQ